MFDGSLPEVAELGSLDDVTLVAAASGWARVESAASARKQAVMAELFRRRTGLRTAEERDEWWVDPTSAVAAELAAAQGVSQGMALAQAHRGVMLADRLPKVQALFEAGVISDLLVRTIVYRTALILDSDALAAVDTALAEQVTRWGALSAKKTQEAIDALVLAHDPGALRRARAAEQSRTVQFGSPLDEPGYTSMWARMHSPDAAVLENRVDDMARAVCPQDPRTMNERRAAALSAMGYGQEMTCECGKDECSAAGRESMRGNVVVHVVADAAAVEQAQTNGAATCPAPAVVLGGGVISGPVLAAFLRRATTREIRVPTDAPPEPRYQPSRALADFIRCRDLTCRFPGCDRPAHLSDIDHTIPYPAGPTSAANLKCLCRFHHLLKTFWDGDHGWRDTQLPDGTIIWTAPTGHTHTTRPGSALLFPTLCQPTGEEVVAPVKAPCSKRSAMMPRRRRTRAQDRAYRITAERRLNDDLVAELTRPPPF